ncbi:MAG: hypothetical protein ACRCTW_09590 [Lactococcus garvieae]
MLKKNKRLEASAQVNTREDFRFTLDDEMDNALTEGYMQNQDFFGALLNNEAFKKRIAQVFVEDVYRSFKN